MGLGKASTSERDRPPPAEGLGACVARRLQVEHARDDDGGRDGGDDEAEEPGPRERQRKHVVRDDGDDDGLAEARHEGEADRDEAHLAQLVEVEAEAGAHHDDGERGGAQREGPPLEGVPEQRYVGAERHVRGVAQQQTREQHAQQRRQLLRDLAHRLAARPRDAVEQRDCEAGAARRDGAAEQRQQVADRPPHGQHDGQVDEPSSPSLARAVCGRVHAHAAALLARLLRGRHLLLHVHCDSGVQWQRHQRITLLWHAPHYRSQRILALGSILVLDAVYFPDKANHTSEI
eukprot:2179039-Pleurochrysis_carterae.AAC.3